MSNTHLFDKMNRWMILAILTLGVVLQVARADEQRTNRVIENAVPNGDLIFRVNDDGIKKDTFKVNGADGDATLSTPDSAAINLWFKNSTATTGFRLGLKSDETAALIQAENKGMEFWTNNLLRMTISSAGVVDIPGSLTLGTALAIAEGGTGSTSASAARTSLGLGTMATQNANSIAVTGGTLSGLTTISSTGTAKIHEPASMWNSDVYGVGNGLLYSSGSFRTSLVSNGYRNVSNTWTSLGAGGFSGASQIDLDPNGYMYFRIDASKANGSSSDPTTRMTLDSTGTLSITNDLSVAGVTTSGRLHSSDGTFQSRQFNLTIGSSAPTSFNIASVTRGTATPNSHYSVSCIITTSTATGCFTQTSITWGGSYAYDHTFTNTQVLSSVSSGVACSASYYPYGGIGSAASSNVLNINVTLPSSYMSSSFQCFASRRLDGNVAFSLGG